MMNKLCIFLLMTCMFIDAQDRKNQIALNADDIIPSLFSSDANSYNILYRRKVKEKKYFRLGLKYLQESKNQFLFGIKPGFDYAFSINTKWVFYYGFDLALVYQDNLQSERKYYESTIIPFFRAEYIISDSFSISTEPGLFFRLIQIEDYDNSPVDNSDSIFSSGIGQLGIININFSF